MEQMGGKCSETWIKRGRDSVPKHGANGGKCSETWSKWGGGGEVFRNMEQMGGGGKCSETWSKWGVF